MISLGAQGTVHSFLIFPGRSQQSSASLWWSCTLPAKLVPRVVSFFWLLWRIQPQATRCLIVVAVSVLILA